jgi:hypothetical protein
MLCRCSVIASGLLNLRPPLVSFAFFDKLEASWISPKLSNAWALPTFLLTACASRSSRANLVPHFCKLAIWRSFLYRYVASCVDMKLSVRAVASLRVVASFVCMDAVSSCDWSADSQFVVLFSVFPHCMTLAFQVYSLRDAASGCCTSVVHCGSNVDVLHRRRRRRVRQRSRTLFDTPDSSV